MLLLAILILALAAEPAFPIRGIPRNENSLALEIDDAVPRNSGDSKMSSTFDDQHKKNKIDEQKRFEAMQRLISDSKMFGGGNTARTVIALGPAIIQTEKNFRPIQVNGKKYNSSIRPREHSNCKSSTSPRGIYYWEERPIQASLELNSELIKPELLKPPPFDDQHEKNKIDEQKRFEAMQRLISDSKMFGGGNTARTVIALGPAIIQTEKNFRQIEVNGKKYNSSISPRKHSNCKSSTSPPGIYYWEERPIQASLELNSELIKPELLKPPAFDDQHEKNKIDEQKRFEAMQRLISDSKMFGGGNTARTVIALGPAIFQTEKNFRQIEVNGKMYNSSISPRKHSNCKSSTSPRGIYYWEERPIQASLELMNSEIIEPKLSNPPVFDNHHKKNKICKHKRFDVMQRLNNVSKMKQGQLGGENSFKSTEMIYRVPVMKKQKAISKKDNEHFRLSISTDGKSKPDSKQDPKHVKLDSHHEVIKNYTPNGKKLLFHQPKLNQKTFKKNKKMRIRRSVPNTNLDSELKFITGLPILKRVKRLKIENNRPVFIPVETIGRILTEKYCTSTMVNVKGYDDLIKDVVNFSDNFSPSPEKLVSKYYVAPCLQQPSREIQELKDLHKIDEISNLPDSIKVQKNVDEINSDYAKQKCFDDRMATRGNRISKQNGISKKIFETLHSYIRKLRSTLRK